MTDSKMIESTQMAMKHGVSLTKLRTDYPYGDIDQMIKMALDDKEYFKTICIEAAKYGLLAHNHFLDGGTEEEWLKKTNFRNLSKEIG